MSGRLLLLTHRYRPDIGGLAASAARMAAALSAEGVPVAVLAWTRRQPAGRLTTCDENGVTVHRFGMFGGWDTTMQHTGNVVDWLVGREPIAALWGHYIQPAGFFAVLTARRLGIPSTVSLRGDDLDTAMFPPGDFSRLLWTLEQADVVTAASADLARKADALLGRAVAEVVPNVVDGDLFSSGEPDLSLRRQLGVEPDEAVLGFSGELRHKKGFQFLLDALVEVRAARPACLLVIGEVRAREQSQLALFAAQRPDDAARVVVTGHLPEPRQVAEHLRLVDLYLQPSLWDGLPNALLEAMACERCVLASDAGGIPDVVENGTSGFVLPRMHLNHLGAAALEVLDLPQERRAAIGASARDRVLHAFHADAERAGLLEVAARLGLSIAS